MIELKSSDGETFEVEKIVVQQSALINRMIEDNCSNSVIPLPNITSETFARVLDYCNRHAPNSNKSGKRHSPNSDELSSLSYWEELSIFYAEFVDVDQKILFDLIMAANYLEIDGLLDLTCRKFVGVIKDRPEKICKMLNIVNDFTLEEEEEEIRRENAWAFD